MNKYICTAKQRFEISAIDTDHLFTVLSELHGQHLQPCTTYKIEVQVENPRNKELSFSPIGHMIINDGITMDDIQNTLKYWGDRMVNEIDHRGCKVVRACPRNLYIETNHPTQRTVILPMQKKHPYQYV